ncbi:hypothetical protein G9A89_001255 [Geosiphon pyriformis]|nr:hypothetical protein G9A89_001255 [Geosiphon pyriformis]
MSDQSDLIQQFVKVASADEQQAIFFLEANNWDLNTALGQFFENPSLTQQTPEQEPTSGIFQSSEPFQRTSSRHSSSGNPPKRVPPSSRSANPQSARVATLGDLEKELPDDEDEEDEPENLFAGGEKSGIFMQNPNAKASSSLVGDILKKAAEGGRGHLEEQNISAPPSQPFFTGTGYTLGSEEEPSIEISNTPPPSSEPSFEEPVVRHLTFWRDGFSIEDGPLMAYNDSANEDFLKAINSGRAPLSLLNVKQGQPVDMRVARKLDEDYKPPPKKPSKPFSGSGQRLGSPGNIISSTATVVPSTSQPSSSANSLRATQLEIDESLPIASIQIRMGDGTR